MLGTPVGTGLAFSEEVRNLIAQEVEAQFGEASRTRLQPEPSPDHESSSHSIASTGMLRGK